MNKLLMIKWVEQNLNIFVYKENVLNYEFYGHIHSILNEKGLLVYGNFVTDYYKPIYESDIITPGVVK